MEEKNEEVFEKEVNNLDKIDESVDKTISDMGTIWKTCCDKLEKDSVCYICGKKIEKEEQFDIISVPEKNVKPGLFALVSICKECNK